MAMFVAYMFIVGPAVAYRFMKPVSAISDWTRPAGYSIKKPPSVFLIGGFFFDGRESCSETQKRKGPSSRG
jgi:hypothetical protein